MSAPTTTREQFHLPPLRLSDFVIHYRNADFHVHQFVLHHHSAYFRTYLDALQPLVPVVRGKKRKRCSVDMSSLEERDGKCSHSPLVRCIELPDEFGIKSPVAGYASENMFLLFLRYLYFCSILHSPPYSPKSDLLAALTDDTLTCTVFPPSCVTKEELMKYTAIDVSTNNLVFCEPLVSLFHYFDCREALKKCEAVVLAPERQRGSPTWGLFWLPIAVRFEMKEVEQKCIEQVVRDKGFRVNDARYKALLERLSPPSMMQVLEAAIRK